MEAAVVYITVNFIAFLVGGILAPIVLITMKMKSLPVRAYEWLVLLIPLLVFRSIWLTQLSPKTDGNIAAEPFIIGLIISGIYATRYYYRECHTMAAPICFGISCFIPVAVYLFMPAMPN